MQTVCADTIACLAGSLMVQHHCLDGDDSLKDELRHMLESLPIRPQAELPVMCYSHYI